MRAVLFFFSFLHCCHSFAPVAPHAYSLRNFQPSPILSSWVSPQPQITTVFMAQKRFTESIKSYFKPVDDGLTFRERLGKLGLAAVLSYGWVSNMSYCVSVSLAWFIFSKQVRGEVYSYGQSYFSVYIRLKSVWLFFKKSMSDFSDGEITTCPGTMERFFGGVRRILRL